MKKRLEKVSGIIVTPPFPERGGEREKEKERGVGFLFVINSLV